MELPLHYFNKKLTKICNGGPGYRVEEASRAHPKGLDCLPNIYNLEMCQLFLGEPYAQEHQTGYWIWRCGLSWMATPERGSHDPGCRGIGCQDNDPPGCDPPGIGTDRCGCSFSRTGGQLQSGHQSNPLDLQEGIKQPPCVWYCDKRRWIRAWAFSREIRFYMETLWIPYS